MKYLLIIGHDDDFGPTKELIEEIREWNVEMRRKRILEDSNPLKPWQEARTIRTIGDEIVVTPGSFSESREKVSAYALISCQSDEEALAIAARHPMAREAVIEVRPIWENIGVQEIG